MIELDGSQHYTTENMQHDTARSAVLAARKLHVLRFTNQEIDRQFVGVCKAIEAAVNANTCCQKEGQP